MMYDPRLEPLPTYPLQRLERLAHDLAWGVYYDQWEDDFHIGEGKIYLSDEPHHINLKTYLSEIWNDLYPNANLLITCEYLIKPPPPSISWPYPIGSHLSEKALQLLNKFSVASMFISYRRAQSSALALLIVSRMKEYGLTPFLDMHPDLNSDGNHLAPGSAWKQEIEKAISEKEYFIVLVGPKTFLEGSYVINELNYAISKGKYIIPIWHDSFDLDQHLPSNLPEIKNVISNQSAIIVEKENPQQYTGALQVLLAHFGVYP